MDDRHVGLVARNLEAVALPGMSWARPCFIQGPIPP